MTPGARIQAAIDLISGAFMAPGDQPPSLDRAIKAFFRTRRYAGSKDRRFVRDLVWSVCRERGLLMALTGQDWQDKPNARLLVLAHIWRDEGPEILSGLCNGEGHAPAPITPTEMALFEAMSQAEPPDWAWVNLPAFLDDALSTSIGKDYPAFHAAMDERANTVLRCNSHRIGRDKLKKRLETETGLTVQECANAESGLQMDSGVDLTALKSFRDGLFDVQDEAAQLACLHTKIDAGQRVLDYCAGGGGKALALASLFPGHGGIDCHDKSADRMKDIPVRAKRAGLKGISALSKKPAGTYDVVLVDAPCSGSGVWRRHPDDRWRWSAEDIDGFVEIQAAILKEASQFVAPDGRLVYMTCSVLEQENQRQKARFLKENKNFAALPVDAPHDLLVKGDLLTRPDLHNCDGFYMAQMVRTG